MYRETNRGYMPKIWNINLRFSIEYQGAYMVEVLRGKIVVPYSYNGVRKLRIEIADEMSPFNKNETGL